MTDDEIDLELKRLGQWGEDELFRIAKALSSIVSVPISAQVLVKDFLSLWRCAEQLKQSRDVAKLVLGDWLEEHAGETRVEIIREIERLATELVAKDIIGNSVDIKEREYRKRLFQPFLKATPRGTTMVGYRNDIIRETARICSLHADKISHDYLKNTVNGPESSRMIERGLGAKIAANAIRKAFNIGQHEALRFPEEESIKALPANADALRIKATGTFGSGPGGVGGTE